MYKTLVASALTTFISHAMRLLSLLLFLLFSLSASAAPVDPLRYVDPFIGTTNYGTCHPGAVCPSGLMSVVPFNVMGSDLNRYDKDKRWWSTPYDATNTYLTGFSHVNLSGVGCPDLGALLLMPTQTDTLCVDFRRYGSTYCDECAHPGYYATTLTRYDIRAEATATLRTARHRYTFNKSGRSHLLLNLGEGLTNESGATVRRVSATEVEGVKLLGGFCYDARQAVYPLYFVMRVVPPRGREIVGGYWKFQRPKQGVEAQFDPDDNKYKLYTHYNKELSGDDIGAYFSFDATAGDVVEVQLSVSAVSLEGARKNLEAEQKAGVSFDEIRKNAEAMWRADLGRIQVEDGTEKERTVFYTALYHLLLHPSVLNDVDGRYPMMESDSTGCVKAGERRYTIFSLWDTYRTVHPLLSLVYPERQTDMMRSLVAMAEESGQMPRWELFGRETYTMEGDPAIIALADTWQRGLRGFDGERAYQMMRKSAMKSGKNNPLRPDNDDYLTLGYIPLRAPNDNSVSHALEYCAADFALAQMAASLGYKADAAFFARRATSYRRYFSTTDGALRPLLPNGSFLTPFNPRQGENFAPVPGFHEGSAWNYTFSASHDVKGLSQLFGGTAAYVKALDRVFTDSLYDPTNEPDLAYPYLFTLASPAEAWRTQRLTRQLLARHFTTTPDGLPGNEDTGTLSAWALCSMLGLYPAVPGQPTWVVTAPVFSRITIQRPDAPIIIDAPGANADTWRIKEVRLGGERIKSFQVAHDALLKQAHLTIRF